VGPHRDLPKPDFTTHEVFEYFRENFGFGMEQTVALMGGHSLGTLSRDNSGFDGPQGWVTNNNRLSNDYYQQIVGGRDADEIEVIKDVDIENLIEDVDIEDLIEELGIEDLVERLARAPQWTQNFVNNSDPSITGRGPDRFQWERKGRRGRGKGPGTIIMLNSDIALTRNLTGHLETPGSETTGEADCKFSDPTSKPNQCPIAKASLLIAAKYKFNNTKFLVDFSDVYNKVLVQGYNTSTTCVTEPCLQTEEPLTENR
jgi:hypothetical protein